MKSQKFYGLVYKTLKPYEGNFPTYRYSLHEYDGHTFNDRWAIVKIGSQFKSLSLICGVTAGQLQPYKYAKSWLEANLEKCDSLVQKSSEINKGMYRKLLRDLLDSNHYGYMIAKVRGGHLETDFAIYYENT